MTGNRSIISRAFALVALVAAVLAVVLLVGSVSSDDDSKPSGTSEAAKSKQKKSSKATKNRQKAYVVKEGDTLTGISERTGVPVDEIEALNPRIDPQALQAGQKLKLR
jgi:LysM repeat protein